MALNIGKQLKFDSDAGIFVRVMNKSGGTINSGEVVVYDPSNTTDRLTAVTTTTTQDDADVAGVMITTTVDDGYGVMQVYGPLDVTNGSLKVDGTTDIAVGDFLSTFTTAGIASKATTGKAGVFAYALAAYATDDSLGTIKAFILQPNRQDASATVSYGTAGQMAADGVAASNAAGTTDATARIDHAHVNTADTPALTLGTSNAVGTAGSVLAADASIALFDATVPSTIQPDASASAGSAGVAARRDHDHAIVASAPVDGSLAAANAEGTDNDFSRSDHEHRAVLLDSVEIEFGTGYDAVMGWETGDASNHALVVGLGASNAVHIAQKADIGSDWNLAADSDPAVYVHNAAAPITEYIQVYDDGTNAHITVVGTAGLDIDVPASQKLSVQVASTDEFNFTATELEVAAANDIQFLGDDGILDSNANPILEVSATASADTYFTLKNAVAGQPIIRVTGTADTGLEVQNAAGEVMFETLSSATPLNWLSISNADTGSPVVFLNPGEDDIGFLFNAKNAEEILSLSATAAAVTYVDILSMSTGVAGPAIKAVGETNTNLRLVPDGTGAVDIVPETAGTAASPSLIFAGDIDTGLFSDTSDEFGFANAGVQSMYLGAANEIIIGPSTSSTFTGTGASLIFDEIVAPAGTATNQAVIYAYDSGGVTIMAQQKSDGTNADL